VDGAINKERGRRACGSTLDRLLLLTSESQLRAILELVEAQEPQQSDGLVGFVNLIDNCPVSDPSNPVAPDKAACVITMVFRILHQFLDSALNPHVKDRIPPYRPRNIAFENLLSDETICRQTDLTRAEAPPILP